MNMVKPLEHCYFYRVPLKKILIELIYLSMKNKLIILCLLMASSTYAFRSRKCLEPNQINIIQQNLLSFLDYQASFDRLLKTTNQNEQIKKELNILIEIKKNLRTQVFDIFNMLLKEDSKSYDQCSVENALISQAVLYAVNDFHMSTMVNQKQIFNITKIDLTDFAQSLRDQLHILKLFRFSEKHSSDLLKVASVKPFNFFNTLIEESNTFLNIQQNHGLFTTWNSVFNRQDNMNYLGEKNALRILYNVSKIFGNQAGSVAERKGLLYLNKQIKEKVLSILKPGDILLEKTPFKLTDKLIPGYWGHVAEWIGGPEELKKMGLWTLIKPAFREFISQGKSIVEALRPGVQINDWDHFSNIDSFAILRRKNNDAKEIKYSVLTSLQQIGKAYDFNFDVLTSNVIVCSELVYWSYPQVPFKLTQLADSKSIDPDAVAQAALDDYFDIVTLVIDGVTQKNPLQTMKKLLSEEK